MRKVRLKNSFLHVAGYTTNLMQNPKLRKLIRHYVNSERLYELARPFLRLPSVFRNIKTMLFSLNNKLEMVINNDLKIRRGDYEFYRRIISWKYQS